jgi:hypothetical protein
MTARLDKLEESMNALEKKMQASFESIDSRIKGVQRSLDMIRVEREAREEREKKEQRSPTPAPVQRNGASKDVGPLSFTRRRTIY